MVMLDHFPKEFKRKTVGLLQHASKSGTECGPGTFWTVDAVNSTRTRHRPDSVKSSSKVVRASSSLPGF